MSWLSGRWFWTKKGARIFNYTSRSLAKTPSCKNYVPSPTSGVCFSASITSSRLHPVCQLKSSQVCLTCARNQVVNYGPTSARILVVKRRSGLFLAFVCLSLSTLPSSRSPSLHSSRCPGIVSEIFCGASAYSVSCCLVSQFLMVLIIVKVLSQI